MPEQNYGDAVMVAEGPASLLSLPTSNWQGRSPLLTLLAGSELEVYLL